MSFARKIWHFIVAFKDGMVLVFMLAFYLALYAVLTARPSAGTLREGALLLRLNGVVVEEPHQTDPFAALVSGGSQTREYRARDLVRAIDLAASDDNIKAVVLDLSQFSGGGLVTMEELGAALDRVRAAKKPVLAYSLFYSDDSLMLAAHASEVWLNPLGGAIVTGPGGNRLYYGDLLKRYNVNVHLFKVGTFKDAVEPYVLNKASDPSKEARTAVLGAIWENWLGDVAKARPKANLKLATGDPAGWIEGAKGDAAQAALSAGLVDKLGDEIAFGERVRQIAGEGLIERPGSFASNRYETLLAAHPLEEEGDAVAVVTVAGEIVDGKAGPGSAGGERIARLIDEANADDAKALVLRVDSPGGSVFASEQIRMALERFKAPRDGVSRPVAVSMANVAASGGYWVSTPAGRIFAQPGTITGSIGIFAILPSFEKTLATYGVNADGVRTTPLSGQPDLVGGLTPDTERLIQGSIENGYARFLGLVSKARGKTPEQIDAIAQGRVWDGGTARQNGLVDQFGGLNDALAWAAGQAKLKEWHPQYYGEESEALSVLDKLMGDDEDSEAQGGAVTDFAGFAAQRQQAMLAGALAELQWLGGVRGAQAYCLDCSLALRAPRPAERGGWLANLAAVLARR